MKQFKRSLILTTCTFFAATTVHLNSWAVDPNAFNSRLQDRIKNTEFAISASRSEADGNDIVLRDVTIKIHGLGSTGKRAKQSSSDQPSQEQEDGNKPDETLVFDKIDNLRFKNVTEGQDGTYFAEKVSIPLLKSTNSGVTTNFQDISIDKIRLAPNKDANPLFIRFPYESATIDRVYFTGVDQTFFNAEDLKMVYLLKAGTKSVDITGSIKSVSYEPNKTGIPAASKWLTDIGYDKLSGSLNFHANWDIDSGKYVGDRNEITIDNGGKLAISTNVDGLTADLVNNLDVLKQLNGSNNTDETTAEMLSVLGIVQQLKFGDVSIRYDDNSLTNRILDYYAKQNGVTREDFITQLKATLPLIGAKIEDPEFVKNTSEQIGNFLDNPKSLTVSATPGKTIPITVLYATGSISAAKLIDLLKVKVEANK